MQLIGKHPFTSTFSDNLLRLAVMFSLGLLIYDQVLFWWEPVQFVVLGGLKVELSWHKRVQKFFDLTIYSRSA